MLTAFLENKEKEGETKPLRMRSAICLVGLLLQPHCSDCFWKGRRTVHLTSLACTHHEFYVGNTTQTGLRNARTRYSGFISFEKKSCTNRSVETCMHGRMELID